MALSRARTTALAAAMVLLAWAIPGSAVAEVTCGISEAAGKPAPPPLAAPRTKGFRIFWHISTQVEDMADAGENPEAMADIRATQKLTDGYLVNLVLNGPYVYWPGRPKQCALNFQRINPGDSVDVLGESFTFDEGGKAGRDQCKARQRQFLRDSGYAASGTEGLQYDALRRVVGNLDLKAESRRGKDISAILILSSLDMSYDAERDAVKLERLPKLLCFLNRYGITPNGLMAYQEPLIQLRAGSFLWVPREKGAARPANPRDDKAPENPRIFDLVEDAFADARVPLGKLYPNIRRWNNPRYPDYGQKLAELPGLGGYNFEFGTGILPLKPGKINDFAAGIAWILANTDKNVSLLMPGYWDRNGIGDDNEIDTLVPRLREHVLAINDAVGRLMKLPKGRNAICDGRMILVPGSYGQPLHVKTLPSERNGKFAGTVTGQIRMLAQMRKELCGV